MSTFQNVNLRQHQDTIYGLNLKTGMVIQCMRIDNKEETCIIFV